VSIWSDAAQITGSGRRYRSTPSSNLTSLGLGDLVSSTETSILSNGLLIARNASSPNLADRARSLMDLGCFDACSAGRAGSWNSRNPYGSRSARPGLYGPSTFDLATAAPVFDRVATSMGGASSEAAVSSSLMSLGAGMMGVNRNFSGFAGDSVTRATTLFQSGDHLGASRLMSDLASNADDHLRSLDTFDKVLPQVATGSMGAALPDMGRALAGQSSRAIELMGAGPASTLSGAYACVASPASVLPSPETLSLGGFPPIAPKFDGAFSTTFKGTPVPTPGSVPNLSQSMAAASGFARSQVSAFSSQMTSILDGVQAQRFAGSTSGAGMAASSSGFQRRGGIKMAGYDPAAGFVNAAETPVAAATNAALSFATQLSQGADARARQALSGYVAQGLIDKLGSCLGVSDSNGLNSLANAFGRGVNLPGRGIFDLASAANGIGSLLSDTCTFLSGMSALFSEVAAAIGALAAGFLDAASWVLGTLADVGSMLLCRLLSSSGAYGILLQASRFAANLARAVAQAGDFAGKLLFDTGLAIVREIFCPPLSRAGCSN